MTAKADEQKTRRALSGSNSGMTYSRQAEIDQGLENQGRFGQTAQVNGREPSVHYPRMPEGSPWAGDPSGVEPPLGVSVDYVEPCGTAVEIAASEIALAELATQALTAEVPSSASSVVETGGHPSIVIEALNVSDLREVLEMLVVKIAASTLHETGSPAAMEESPEQGTSESVSGLASSHLRGSPPTNPPPSTSIGIKRRKGL